MTHYTDIKGKRFGRLVALEYLGHSMWRCKCDCGTVKDIAFNSLNKGYTVSCGCYHRDVCSGKPAINRTHNMRNTPEYNIWSMMKNRCVNPNCNRHQFYKDKGVKVCDRWLGPDGFIHFIEDMGMRPGPNHSIDRIDNDGDYCPENCRWATDKEQANNHNNNFIVEYNGRRQTLALWCEELSLPYGTIWMRFRRGWSAKKAFEQPLRRW